MKHYSRINILKKKETFSELQYEAALDFADMQTKNFWKHNSTNIAGDIQDLRFGLTPHELEVIPNLLMLFTLYEMRVGSAWKLFGKIFPHPDIICMTDTFSFMENNVHLRAYNEINKLLKLDTKAFYESYKQYQELSDRVEYIDSVMASIDPTDVMSILRGLAAFNLIEGAILSSSFAILKSFTSNGRNVLKGISAAIGYTIKDEFFIHQPAGAWLFKQLKKEAELTKDEEDQLNKEVHKLAKGALEHENKIVDFYMKGQDLTGMTIDEIKQFIDHRVSVCVRSLGVLSYPDIEAGNVGTWFYNTLSGVTQSDFFTVKSSAYQRRFSKGKFTFKQDI